MRCFEDARGLGENDQPALKRLRIEALSLRTWEEPTFPALANPFAQDKQQLRADRDVAVLLAFPPADVEHGANEIDVADFEVAQFRDARPSQNAHLDHDEIAPTTIAPALGIAMVGGIDRRRNQSFDLGKSQDYW